MRAGLLVTSVCVGVLVAAGGPACGHSSPIAPSVPSGASQPASLVRMQIVGTARLGSVGETTQLKAMGTFSDGTSKDLGTAASWYSSDSGIASVSAGLVRANALGRVTIYANSNGPNGHASLEVTIVPPGTYYLFGSVTEPVNYAVDGATVEIVAGQGAGKSTMTKYGNYALPGVVGDFQLRVSKSGYIDQMRSLSVNQDTHVSFELAQSSPVPAVSGTYRVTMQAAAGCQLPQEAMTRSYTAAVMQTNAQINVSLGGAQFDHGSAGFTGRALGNSITFTINDDYYYGFDVLEKVSDSMYLAFFGTVTGAFSNGTITGSLNGTVETFAGSPYFAATSKPTATCTSGAHQLIFASASSTAMRRR